MSKLRTWRVLLYVALLSFVYASGFIYYWINGWDMATFLYIPNLVQLLFGIPLTTLVIWYILVKIVDCLNEYLPISGGRRAS